MKEKNFIHQDPIIRQVLLLTIIGLIGFALNLVINSYILKISESYTNEINNQLSKKELGIYLHNKIIKIESGIKDLVHHSDKRKTFFIINDIESNLSDIEDILVVINKGGFVVHELPVNFYQSDFILDTIFYKANDRSSFNIDVIDISPKIVEIRNISKKISIAKIELFNNPQDQQLSQRIVILNKEVATYMERAIENVNRIFYDTHKDYQSIKAEKINSIERLKKVKSIWIAIISIVTLILLAFIFKRITMLVRTKNKNEQKLISSNKSIEKILNAIPVGFVIFDKNYKVKKVNREALYLFGASHEDAIINKRCSDLFSNQDYEICPFLNISNNPVNNELIIKTLLGNRKNVLKNAIGIELDGEKVVLETFIDITKRKEIEESLKKAKESAELATQEKSKFLASMSHEIRTPLNGIIGMTSLMGNSELDEKQKGYLDIIQISSNNLVSIISDILDFSKIEAGEIQIDKHDFNIKTELENNLKALSLKAEEKGIELKLKMEDHIPEYIYGDSIRIKQVFINLVSNAIKFTEKGFVKVYLSYSNHKSQLRISVTDSGIGIPENRIHKIFDAFSQTDGSITRKFGGTGLGLTISKELVELMEGNLTVSSEIGKGSTFSIELPAPIGSKPKQKPSPKINTETGKAKLSILVAEDNIINQKVAIALFQKLGYNIDIAENGLEAVEMYKKKNYQMIFMDLQMPVMDGLTATKEIMDIAHVNNTSVFITAMTANALKEDKNMCIQSGMKYFLSKPYKTENIEEAVYAYSESLKRI